MVIAYISEPTQLAYIVHNFEWRSHSSPVDELFLVLPSLCSGHQTQHPVDVRDLKVKQCIFLSAHLNVNDSN